MIHVGGSKHFHFEQFGILSYLILAQNNHLLIMWNSTLHTLWSWCMWCDQAKWVCKLIFFWLILLGYYLSFNLVKIPWRLGYWFSRYIISSDCKNNKKQRELSALFGWIFKLIFASSDWVCLIVSQILLCPYQLMTYFWKWNLKNYIFVGSRNNFYLWVFKIVIKIMIKNWTDWPNIQISH